MEISLVKLMAALVLPPGGNFALIVLGFVASARYRRAGRALMGLGVVSLYLLCTPLVVDELRSGIEAHPARTPADIVDGGAQAIVVLGGGRYPIGPEFGGETVSEAALVRLRYGAWLARETGLPVLVTGGTVWRESVPEAELMRTTAADAFGLDVRWVEDRSVNTAENASLSAKLLRAEGIEHVAVVSHAIHMRRAVRMFEGTGLTVTAAPTQLDTRGDGEYLFIARLVPSANALHVARQVLHEWLGIAWYAMRY